MADKISKGAEGIPDLTGVPALPTLPATPSSLTEDVFREDVILTIENLHKKIYTMAYRNRFRVAFAQLAANDIKDAQRRGEAYCKKFNLIYISVVHFFLDPNAPPRDSPRRNDED